MTNESVDEDYALWWLLAQIRHAIIIARTRELKRYDLSPIKSEVLYILKLAEEGLKPSEIARLMFRKPNSVTGIIDRMQKQGLLSKIPDPQKGSAVRIVLTKKGKLAYLKTTSDLIHSPHNFFANVSRKERIARTFE